jgi:hypothetical protein
MVLSINPNRETSRLKKAREEAFIFNLGVSLLEFLDCDTPMSSVVYTKQSRNQEFSITAVL